MANTWHVWALRGAGLRLKALELERAAIVKAFPDLRAGQAPADLRAGRKRRKLSAVGRAAIAAAAKKRWAAARKAKVTAKQR